jgi:transcriptional regulator of met regulon
VPHRLPGGDLRKSTAGIVFKTAIVHRCADRGPGEDAELLRRREVLIPEKLKFITRKSNLQKPI